MGGHLELVSSTMSVSCHQYDSISQTYHLPLWLLLDRYHNHEASKRIEKEYSDEIEKLRSDDGDFHHGFNSGLLAATRMFNEQADILHINGFDEMTKDFQNEAGTHTETSDKTKESFPNLEVSHNKFPAQTV